jgi:hypothetical protein
MKWSIIVDYCYYVSTLPLARMHGGTCRVVRTGYLIGFLFASAHLSQDYLQRL